MRSLTTPVHSTTRTAVRLLAISLLMAAGFALSARPAAAGLPSANGPAPDPRVAGLEMDFLMGMITHHRGAIRMAEMALEKSPQQETRELAKKIIDEQQSEIILMTNYLRDWYGVEPPEGDVMPMDIMQRMDMPMLRGMMPDMAARMQRLESLSGTEFDIEFMSAMVDHHSMASMMASAVLLAGYHDEVYMLGSQILITQGMQIQELQRRLAAWYGVNPPR